MLFDSRSMVKKPLPLCGKRQAGSLLQITTLRTQLSSILKKCDVERQSDLVPIVSSIPVVHPLPSETDHT